MSDSVQPDIAEAREDVVEILRSSVAPSAPLAPTTDENGFIVVSGENNEHPIETVAKTLAKETEEIKRLVDILPEIAKLPEVVKQPEIVKVTPTPVIEQVKPKETVSEPTQKSTSVCTACPYYLMGFNYLKNVRLPQKVEDLVLWKCTKLSGAVFGSTLVLLLSLGCYSFLTVLGSVLLLALTVAGAYRFYLSLMYRIKGQYDDTFDKLSSFKLNIPKEKFQEFSGLVEKDLNKLMNQLKSIVLWDDLGYSLMAFFGFYIVYCIGSVFNTLTLLTMAWVAIFTLPKFYQVYQRPIDQGIAKITDISHNIARQISAKLPFLHKKKTQ